MQQILIADPLLAGFTLCCTLYFTLSKLKFLCFLDSMRRMQLKLFPTENIVTDERNNDDGEEDEERNKELSVELAKQRGQIRRLQKTVEDQSRLLQEISHQLKQTARLLATTEGSVQETTL